MFSGGKFIIVFLLIMGKGIILRIVFIFDEGVLVIILRNDVDYVIIEYGIVYLRGKILRERVKFLIEIVYLDFREEFRKKVLEKFGEL